jgi:hypothetical protein
MTRRGRPAPGSRLLHEDDFSRLHWFSQREITQRCEEGRWNQIDAGSLYLLDHYAGVETAIGTRLIGPVALSPAQTAAGTPTATWNRPETGAHAPDSAHHVGRAFDIMPRASLALAWLLALRYPWYGIGAYPFWSPRPGLHLDTRPRPWRALWYVDVNGSYHYFRSPHEAARGLNLILGAPTGATRRPAPAPSGSPAPASDPDPPSLDHHHQGTHPPSGIRL